MGEVIEIPLTRGMVALIDAADFPLVGGDKWYALASRRQNRWYARRQVYPAGGGRLVVHMHREIMCAAEGVMVDHINGNGLDNRRCNLRLASAAQNAANRIINPRCASGYKGVEARKRLARPFFAVIGGRPNREYLGCFSTPEEAARAYDDAARLRWGQHARLNFPLPGEQGCHDGVSQ